MITSTEQVLARLSKGGILRKVVTKGWVIASNPSRFAATERVDAATARAVVNHHRTVANEKGTAVTWKPLARAA